MGFLIFCWSSLTAPVVVPLRKNGQAECKHGYILDIVRALLLPENIKGHTMLSINRVPFPTILQKSSHDYHCYTIIATVYEFHSLRMFEINPLQQIMFEEIKGPFGMCV